MRYSDSINTNGIIVHKLNHLYTLFYISIYDNQLFVIPKYLNDNEVKDVFMKNSFNQDVEGLAEFFDVGRERK